MYRDRGGIPSHPAAENASRNENEGTRKRDKRETRDETRVASGKWGGREDGLHGFLPLIRYLSSPSRGRREEGGGTLQKSSWLLGARGLQLSLIGGTK